MCEDCETGTLQESYAQKRARIAAVWQPKRYDAYQASAVEPPSQSVTNKPDEAKP